MKKLLVYLSLVLPAVLGLSSALSAQNIVPAYQATAENPSAIVQAVYNVQSPEPPIRQVQYQQPIYQQPALQQPGAPQPLGDPMRSYRYVAPPQITQTGSATPIPQNVPSTPGPIQQAVGNGIENNGAASPNFVVPAVPLLAQTQRIAPLPQAAVPNRPIAAEAVAGRYQLKNITPQTLETQLVEKLGKRFVPVKNVESTPNLAKFRLPVKDGTDVELTIDRQQGIATLLGSAPMVESCVKLIQFLDFPNGNGTAATEVVPLQRGSMIPVKQAVETIAQETQKDEKQLPTATQPKPQTQEFQRSGDSPAARFTTPNASGASSDLLSSGIVGPIQIDIIDGLEQMVIRGPKKDVQQILEMINQLESMSLELEPVVELVAMQNADSYRISQVVQQLYAQVYQARRGSITMLPLVKPNTILLIGKKESIATAKELIAKLDTPVAPESEYLVIRLKNASSDALQTYLTNFYANRQNLGAQVVVFSDFRTNSLIVQGSKRDLAEVESLVQKLDADGPDAVNTVKIIPLRNAMATQLATTLQNTFTGTTGTSGLGGGGGTTQTTRSRTPAVQFLTQDAAGNLLRANVLFDVKITADTQSNSLIVSAPESSMALIEAVIHQLDQLPSAESQIKVFKIVNGDATTLTTVLQTLFAQTSQSGGGFGGGTQGSSQIATVRPGIEEGESTLVSVRFATDTRTNSIIACGTAGDLNVVEAILLRLDEENKNNRKVMVIKLVNKPAESLAPVLNSYITSERQLEIQNSGSFYPQSPQEQYRKEVVIVAEPLSNSLIISSTPKYYNQIRKIVQQLDERPLMVAIQVLIAEVTLTDNCEFGVEFGLQDSILFNRSSYTSGAGMLPGFLFGDAQQGLPLEPVNPGAVGSQGITSFNMGRTNSNNVGGFVFSASSESVSLLLRALEEEHKLRVLSRPQITTLHNLRGTVQVGQKVPYVSDTNLNYGVTSNTVQYMDVGMILDVTPRVTPDGMIVMDLYAEKSNVGNLSDGIPIQSQAGGTPLYSPKFNITKAQTTVSAMDGQTIVFAGLITETKETTKRGVPVLNKIPVIKHLFEYESSKKERTEMLIVMTPTIIRSEIDMEILKQQEASRMHWCICDVVQLTKNSKMRLRTDPWSACEVPQYMGRPVILNESQLPSEDRIFQTMPLGEAPEKEHQLPGEIKDRPHIPTPMLAPPIDAR